MEYTLGSRAGPLGRTYGSIVCDADISPECLVIHAQVTTHPELPVLSEGLWQPSASCLEPALKWDLRGVGAGFPPEPTGGHR